MSALEFVLCAAVFCALWMSLTWILARRLDNYSIVDVAWAAAFGACALGAVGWGTASDERKHLIGGLMLFWSLRLGSHLGARIFSHIREEDGRYRKLREEYGEHVGWRFFLFFQMQAASVVFLLIPLYFTAWNESLSLHPLELIGASWAALGLIGEAWADRQLHQFKSDPAHRGKVCDVGWWRYSRHPNYFFEATYWWGLGTIGAAGALTEAGSAWALLAVLAPVTMLWLLLKVTGVPLAEAQSLRSRGDAYREYQRRTRIFFPGPRRS